MNNWVMNNFLSGVIFCCQTGPFSAETAVKSSRLPVLDMFINIRHIRGFNKTLKKIFVNNISWILVIETRILNCSGNKLEVINSFSLNLHFMR